MLPFLQQPPSVVQVMFQGPPGEIKEEEEEEA